MIRPPHRATEALAPLSASTLVLIDAQRTYTTGPLELDGIGASIDHAAELLARARAAGAPVVHVQHDAGEGSLFDVGAESGAIVEALAPREDEATVVKAHPNSFFDTGLEQLLGDRSRPLVIAGFMTHMCVDATSRAAFDLGYSVNVVAAATATRPLPGLAGEVPAATVKSAALAALGDAFAVVVETEDLIPS
ncbi:MAG: cysteine hydrolase [Actinobacteria bacterium]|nr:cysteine hydrolase [Actinomycetota bacterium]